MSEGSTEKASTYLQLLEDKCFEAKHPGWIMNKHKINSGNIEYQIWRYQIMLQLTYPFHESWKLLTESNSEDIEWVEVGDGMKDVGNDILTDDKVVTPTHNGANRCVSCVTHWRPRHVRLLCAERQKDIPVINIMVWVV